MVVGSRAEGGVSKDKDVTVLGGCLCALQRIVAVRDWLVTHNRLVLVQDYHRWMQVERNIRSCLRHGQGVAGQGPRVVCERFLENKVHAAQSAAGREAPLRVTGGLGGGGALQGPQAGFGAAPRQTLKILKI